MQVVATVLVADKVDFKSEDKEICHSILIKEIIDQEDLTFQNTDTTDMKIHT